MTQLHVSEGIARRARRDTAGGHHGRRDTGGGHRAKGPASGAGRPPDPPRGIGRASASAPPRGIGRRPRSSEIATSAHLEAEIAELHAALAAEAAARPADPNAAADAADTAAERVARAASVEMGKKGAQQYAALVKQQLASVRRAERCELVRAQPARKGTNCTRGLLAPSPAMTPPPPRSALTSLPMHIASPPFTRMTSQTHRCPPPPLYPPALALPSPSIPGQGPCS